MGLSLCVFMPPKAVHAYNPAETPVDGVLSLPDAAMAARDEGRQRMELVQTTEVTIQLEKKMPAPVPENSPEPPPPPVEFEDLQDPFKDETPDILELRDPFVGVNRVMFRINENIYDYVMDPVAREYKKIVSEDIRIAIRNMFNNAMTPVKFVSSLLQGDINKSTRVLGRVIINSTIGVGGLFDVADQHFHIDDVNEDFEQALGYRGVPTGPYFVIPFMGPLTARHIVGRVVDSFLSPTVLFAPGFAAGAAMGVTDKINDISFILEDKESLDESAIDKYESVRDFYHQYREGLIRK
ncbi:MAG: VacJ family lipoprotein [Nitrospinae bacterium]|nr:VacJ family lipoprotein [Nitrospinota bacterium]